MSDRAIGSRVSHVIFDLDGTLIDTEQWSLDVLNLILAKYDKHCTNEDYSKNIGFGSHERAGRLVEMFDLSDYDGESFLKEWVTECRKQLNDIQLMPGVERVVEHLHKNGIPMAIATSGKTLEYFSKTQHIPNVFEEGKYFHHVIHGDDPRVQRLKPFPDILEICFSEFDPKPESHQNVLVVEDNSVGIEAAVAAGMQSLLVNDKRFFQVKESKANVVINGLPELDPQAFGLPPF